MCFIGDGINDLPAIKEADLGIAMEEGTTITKEVSDIVLLKNKFSLLPEIFNEGNRIINTIRYITTLYLVKNFSVLIVVLLDWFFTTPFFLTPRKSSLLSALAVGLPSYFISFKNSNTNKTTHFYRSVISYVLTSSFFIILFSYLGYFISLNFFNLPTYKAANIMFSIYTLGIITSFFTLVAFENKSNYNYYAFYATLMAVLFIFFSAVQINFPPFNIISEFYEFEILSLNEFLLVAFFFILMSSILFYFQKYQYNRSQSIK